MKNKTFIIAEAGVNHNGDLTLALNLVKAARAAGADAVKFQTFRAGELVSSSAPKAEYQLRTTDKKESQLEMIRKLELSESAHHDLIKQCSAEGIIFLSSAFDMPSLEFLFSLNLPLYKIPSGEISNKAYLQRIGSAGKPVVLSTGMCDLSDVERALEVLLGSGLTRDRITLLHCNTEYPTPVEDVNLRAMTTLAKAFGTPVGYSDHTAGIEISIAAVALGAVVIEKHLTLDHSLPGPDHRASLEPDEFRRMVLAIRNIERALGDGIKQPSSSERKNIAIARKSLVARIPVKAGEIFTAANLAAKRPGVGISPMRIDEVLGAVAKQDFDTDDLIKLDG